MNIEVAKECMMALKCLADCRDCIENNCSYFIEESGTCDNISIAKDALEIIEEKTPNILDNEADCTLSCKTFADIKPGDVVKVFDEYSHDYSEHLIKVRTIEYLEENITATNPKGKTCHGDDLNEDEWGNDYITVVTECNYVGLYKEG